MIAVRSYMRAVPEMARFLTLDELLTDIAALAEQYPDLARLRRVGSSTLGEPINLLSIGHGSKQAFIFGCPHPNEPIGAMMVHHFTRLLCEDADLRAALDYTWHIIPCIDPDGTRLNEGWFAGPFTPTNYARHFYRPAGYRQVEWTFPISYKQLYFDRTLPETETLMRVIDEVQPTLLYSLHNAGFGGVYYYLGRRAAPLYPALLDLPAWEDLPLNLGEPEVPYAEVFGPAIYKMFTARESYDYLEAHGADMTKRSTGTSSHDYASRYNSFTLVVEMPYFDDPRVNDQTPTVTLRRDAILAGLDLQEELATAVGTHYRAVASELRGRSPFEAAVASTLDLSGEMLAAQRRWAREDPDTNRPATVAECFSNDQMRQFYRLLTVGQLVRLLEGEIGIGNGTPAIRQHLAGAQALFTDWAAKLEGALQYRAIPIRRLVAVQLGAALATAAYLQDEAAANS